MKAGKAGSAVAVSVIRSTDKAVFLTWVITLVVCLLFYESPIESETWVLSIPFAVTGFVCLLCNRRYPILIVLTAIFAVVCYIFRDSFEWLPVYLAFYLCFGAIGVAAMVDAIERVMYFRVLSHIRYVNIKEKLGLRDRLAGFVFSVPHDIDTRNLAADLTVRDRKITIDSFLNTYALAAICAMFVWIYLAFEPSFVTLTRSGDDTFVTSVMYVFTVLLYIPLIIMPFSIFANTKTRIVSPYRDFQIYNGFVSTVQRMAIPIIGALVIVLFAVTSNKDWLTVLIYIGISAALMAVIISLTMYIHAFTMEPFTVTSIGRKWKQFMPVSLLSGLDGESDDDDRFPGTPAREERDYCGVEVSQKERRLQ